MKHFTLLFLLATLSGFAQDKQTKNFFADITNGTVYYSHGWLTENNTRSLNSELKKDEIKSAPQAEGYSLKLTKSEKKTIKKEAKKLIGIEAKTYLSGVKNFEFTEKFDLQKHKSLSFFSKPIFIRSNSICFVYASNTAGALDGSGGWNVYKKENGKWVRWIKFADWAS